MEKNTEKKYLTFSQWAKKYGRHSYSVQGWLYKNKIDPTKMKIIEVKKTLLEDRADILLDETDEAVPTVAATPKE